MSLVAAEEPAAVGDAAEEPAAAGDAAAATRSEGGWRALRVAGTLDFSLVGVLASLAAARVPIFALPTFDTDYVLVKAGRLGDARDALARAGHSVGKAA